MFLGMGGERVCLSVKHCSCAFCGREPLEFTHTHTHSMTYSAFIHSATLHLLFIPFFHTPTHTKAAQSHNSGACRQGCVQDKAALMTWPIRNGQREKERENTAVYWAGERPSGECVWSWGQGLKEQKRCVCVWG